MVKFTVLLLYVCALSGKAIPEVTYTVLVDIKPSRSLTVVVDVVLGNCSCCCVQVLHVT